MNYSYNEITLKITLKILNDYKDGLDFSEIFDFINIFPNEIKMALKKDSTCIFSAPHNNWTSWVENSSREVSAVATTKVFVKQSSNKNFKEIIFRDFIGLLDKSLFYYDFVEYNYKIGKNKFKQKISFYKNSEDNKSYISNTTFKNDKVLKHQKKEINYTNTYNFVKSAYKKLNENSYDITEEPIK
jgi:hypothetical protein